MRKRKNHAYGRHQISRPMRIVALMPRSLFFIWPPPPPPPIVKQFRGSGYYNFLGDRYPNHESYRAEILREYSNTNTCHMSGVICHVSRIRCHMSCVIFFFKFFLQIGGACWWMVSYQWDLPCLVIRNGWRILVKKILQPQYTSNHQYFSDSNPPTKFICVCLCTCSPGFLFIGEE